MLQGYVEYKPPAAAISPGYYYFLVTVIDNPYVSSLSNVSATFYWGTNSTLYSPGNWFIYAYAL